MKVMGAGGTTALLAGCLGGGQGNGTDSTDGGGGGTGTDDDPDSGSRSGGTFTFALGSEPTTLDTHETRRVPEQLVLDAVTEPLFRLDQEKKPVPHLVSNTERNDDASEFTFTIKDGVTFHDGETFDAESAAWNIDRFLDVGTNAYILGDPARVEATGEMELTVGYDSPKPRLPTLLTNWYVGMVSKAAVDDAGEDYGVGSVVGTGPFSFDQWSQGQSISLSRFDEYTWGPEFADNTGPANVSAVEFRVIPEATTRINELTSGNVDGTSYIPLSDIENVADSDGATVHETDFPYPAYFPLNMQRSPTDDITVRKAIAHAIRREPIVNAAVGGHGTQIHALAPPSSVNGLTEEAAMEVGYEETAEKARQLFEEAGWTNASQGETRTKDGDSLTLTMLAFDLNQWSTQGEVAQSLLGEVGVEVNLEVVEGGTFYSKLENQEYHTLTGGTGAYFAVDFLDSAFHSDNVATTGGFNNSMIESSELDELIETAKSAPEEAARVEAVKEAQRFVMEQAAAVPVMTINRTYGNQNPVGGLEAFLEHDWYPIAYFVHWTDVTL
ncbi:ABC transporter substrate-binding protein [Halomarina oriensis]|uniref:ABC transporter substrate-binding protein n=1 Tax=Halomarina oriensis TaxID=671145 RepID=A0A6B0GFY9_9EURY|nr:ABC transporter substrate-binding protein [Halomarina oriensis]MWG33430.1 ABC transporter substrate-binding protein [Halomarina oriensis]